MTEALLSTKSAQLTDTLLMVSPDQFGFNDQTADTNAFQNSLSSDSGETLRKAMAEFNTAVGLLRSHGIKIAVCPSRTDANTPDAVFPNNWVSFHNELGGTHIILYPMLAPNRRAERQLGNVCQALKLAIDPSAVLDLTHYETTDLFLEGTGSLIFDRRRKVVFAHESDRTSFPALDIFCDQTGYRPVKFHAYDKGGTPIYHTNIVMNIGEGFSVVCFEAIPDNLEYLAVRDELETLGLETIPITLDQLHSFCGNVLEAQSILSKRKIIMSTTAYGAFTEDQKRQLLSHGGIVPIDIPTIETIGGGSARCMLAEVFRRKVS